MLGNAGLKSVSLWTRHRVYLCMMYMACMHARCGVMVQTLHGAQGEQQLLRRANAQLLMRIQAPDGHVALRVRAGQPVRGAAEEPAWQE